MRHPFRGRLNGGIHIGHYAKGLNPAIGKIDPGNSVYSKLTSATLIYSEARSFPPENWMSNTIETPLLSALGLRKASAPTETVGAGVAAAVGSPAGASFVEALNSALKSVSATQATSESAQRGFQMGAEGVTLESTMMAMQSSQIAFQSALTVRNRMVAAYTDIMNMTV